MDRYVVPYRQRTGSKCMCIDEFTARTQVGGPRGPWRESSKPLDQGPSNQKDSPMSKVSGLLLLPNGTRKDVTCDAGSFDDLRPHVDQWFDVVRTENPSLSLVTMRGCSNNPINIWSIVLLPEFGIAQPLAGPVFLFGGTNDVGEMLSLPQDVLDKIPSTLRPAAGFEVRMVDLD